MLSPAASCLPEPLRPKYMRPCHGRLWHARSLALQRFSFRIIAVSGPKLQRRKRSAYYVSAMRWSVVYLSRYSIRTIQCHDLIKLNNVAGGSLSWHNTAIWYMRGLPSEAMSHNSTRRPELVISRPLRIPHRAVAIDHACPSLQPMIHS